jgi:multiple sugar transport system permease protein
VAALLVTPAILLILFLVAYPIIRVFTTSLTNENLLRIGQGEGVGLSNYAEVFQDSRVRASIVTTLVYAGVSTIAGYLIGITMAFGVERARQRWKSFLRGMFLIPYATTAVVVAFLFRYMLDPQVGVVNYLMQRFGLVDGPTFWLTNSTLALVAVILASIWKTAPFFMLMIAAGLRGIPDDVNDAAAVDGAVGWSKFMRVTLPLLMPISIVAMALNFIRLLNAFPIIWTMTGGGPVDATTTTIIEVYRLAFRDYQLGYSSALGFMWLIVIVVITLAYVSLSRRTEEAQGLGT